MEGVHLLFDDFIWDNLLRVPAFFLAGLKRQGDGDMRACHPGCGHVVAAALVSTEMHWPLAPRQARLSARSLPVSPL